MVGCEVIMYKELSPKPQMSESKSNRICVVVDRQCGDDLVRVVDMCKTVQHYRVLFKTTSIYRVISARLQIESFTIVLANLDKRHNPNKQEI